jgi:hypothetical protein
VDPIFIICVENCCENEKSRDKNIKYIEKFSPHTTLIHSTQEVSKPFKFLYNNHTRNDNSKLNQIEVPTTITNINSKLLVAKSPKYFTLKKQNPHTNKSKISPPKEISSKHHKKISLEYNKNIICTLKTMKV